VAQLNVLDQVVFDKYALYNGDCCEVLQSLPDNSVHLSLYSPPFAGLFHYSSSERDLSNSRTYEEFMLHYEFVVCELCRLCPPGRLTGVHCMDVPTTGANLDGELVDFPGDIIRMHKRLGFKYVARYCVWKEPLTVRNRTMAKSLMHRQIVEDSARCDNAGADYLLMFRKGGENKVPITHPEGLLSYAGARKVPGELLKYKGWKGNQIQNRYSHWIWRKYASAFWDDVRLDRVLPFTESYDSEDEKHIHPLQLDVIERAVILWSNPGEVVLSPFAGVGSEVVGAVMNGRKGIGIELKPSYYRQSVKNLKWVVEQPVEQQYDLFSDIDKVEERNLDEKGWPEKEPCSTSAVPTSSVAPSSCQPMNGLKSLTGEASTSPSGFCSVNGEAPLEEATPSCFPSTSTPPLASLPTCQLPDELLPNLVNHDPERVALCHQQLLSYPEWWGRGTDYTSEWELTMVRHRLSGMPHTLRDEADLCRIMEFRARSKDCPPEWGAWCEFPVESPSGPVIVLYQPWEDCRANVRCDLHGPISETGFRTFQACGLLRPADGETLLAWAVRVVQCLHAGFVTKPKKRKPKKAKEVKE
jgi:DNA modification methylase